MVIMMRKYGLLVALATLVLTACGGGSLSSGSSTTPTTSSSSSSSSSGGVAATAHAITLISSVPQIPSDNATPVTITAIVQNANNAVIVSAPVTFSATSGVIAPSATSATGSVAGITDSNGEAQATLTTPGNPSDRAITVTATVGTISATINVGVVGTKLSLTGPTSLIQGATGNFSVALTDSGGNGIVSTAVTLSSALGNTITAQANSNSMTDNSGHLTFTVAAAKAGQDTITATALGLTTTAPLTISSQSFNFTSPAANTNVALGASETITVVWTNAGTPQANQQVSFSTTRGTFAGGGTTTTATTDSTGTATAIVSATTAGPALITAAAPNVSAQLSLSFVATNPARITAQASPATVQVSGQSTITAIVFDAQDNLVEGQTIDFQLTDKTGGSISVATAVTNAQGVAQTVYNATTVASAADGVVITATVQDTALQATVDLTVGGQTLFISLGTGNTVIVVPPPSGAATSTQFSLSYTAQALDAGGNPVTGVPLTFTVHSFPYVDVPMADLNDPGTGDSPSNFAAYEKGFWTAVGSTDAANCNGVIGTSFCQVVTATCTNEDVNGSGILQSPSEDINGNGKLDPGDIASVAPVASGSETTDGTGSAYVNILYPQDHAAWVHVLLTATATVAGTQSSSSADFYLPILAADVDGTTNGSPPGSTSPYGIATACQNPD
jgi:hypothetical protein